MLKRVMIGQYYNTQSAIHRLDARLKVLLTIAFMVMIFFATNAWGYLALFVFIFAVAVFSNVPLNIIARSVRPLMYILIFTFLLNVLFIQGETELFSWWVIRVTREALIQAVMMTLRLLYLVMGTSLLTLTTSPIELTDGMERLMSPLKVFRFPAHELAMMMSIALRFIPTLLDEADKTMKAQASRGADFETGGLITRAKNIVPLLIPLFVSAFKRADDLALAMESRCYRGGKGRTSMKVFRLEARDGIAFVLLAMMFYCIVMWG